MNIEQALDSVGVKWERKGNTYIFPVNSESVQVINAVDKYIHHQEHPGFMLTGTSYARVVNSTGQEEYHIIIPQLPVELIAKADAIKTKYNRIIRRS